MRAAVRVMLGYARQSAPNPADRADTWKASAVFQEWAVVDRRRREV
jgi:hypothetical protein